MLKVLIGFLAAPLVVYLSLLAQTGVFAFLLIAGTVLMLFFRNTRAYSLGALLSVGVSFLVLLAICGGNNSF